MKKDNPSPENNDPAVKPLAKSADEKPSRNKSDEVILEVSPAETSAGVIHRAAPYLQNRELSWLTFDERVLDQGADSSVPLLDRLNFISIFWSNLQEFFMVRVGSLTDLSLVKKQIIDSKSGMTPSEQLDAIYARCHELYPVQERIYAEVRHELSKAGVKHLRPKDLHDEQRAFLMRYISKNVIPYLSPQIINSRHPFPHLENGALYVVVRLNEEASPLDKTAAKTDKAKNLAAEGVTMGLIPMPHQCERIITLPGEGLQYILLEYALEMACDQVFSMYDVKHTNIICVTRNADLDATEGTDESDDDYLSHMKRILKKRARLAPVRLESERPLSSMLEKALLKRLELKPHQAFVTTVPLDMSYTWGLGSRVPKNNLKKLTSSPFTPQWPSCLQSNRSIIEQVSEKEVLLSYPYETMDAFVQLLREAAVDPDVISIKITLYRLASRSHLAEALILAAENGKHVTALFELRARFDESNNIEWSQRFEQAGCNVIYGFRDLKVHSKICCITRQTEQGLQHITQLGTGNYNEKTAKLYTDLSFITTDEDFGRNATEFFLNMSLENTSDSYDTLWVAPLQIKPMILKKIDEQIELAQAGKPCGLFFKTNSITDKAIIEKIVKASQAGVSVTLFVRGISCIVPGLEGYTENVRVVSIVGRLLEHSRIYGFGPHEDQEIYLSSADLMTRNMDKRVEIAWPLRDKRLRDQVLEYLDICLSDTAKLRVLQSDKNYTPLGFFIQEDESGKGKRLESQKYLIKQAKNNAERQRILLEEKTTTAKIASQRSGLEEVAALPESQDITEAPCDIVPDESKVGAVIELSGAADVEVPGEVVVEVPREATVELSGAGTADLPGEMAIESPSEATVETSPLLDAQAAVREAEAIAAAATAAAELAAEAAARAIEQAEAAAKAARAAQVSTGVQVEAPQTAPVVEKVTAHVIDTPQAAENTASTHKELVPMTIHTKKPGLIRRLFRLFSKK